MSTPSPLDAKGQVDLFGQPAAAVTPPSADVPTSEPAANDAATPTDNTDAGQPAETATTAPAVVSKPTSAKARLRAEARLAAKAAAESASLFADPSADAAPVAAAPGPAASITKLVELAVARPVKDVDYGLAGRRIVITGAAQGIGAACARLLASQGAALALWDVDLERASALAAELVAQGANCHALRCDVSLKAEVDAALAATITVLGGIDGAVSNAGIFRAAPFLDVAEADWDAVIGVNLKGSFLVTQACARAMAAAGGGGAIVLMSSVNGVMAIPDIASYNASKGGIDQLTRAAALAMADHGIRVNAVGPGTIATELAAAAVLTSDAARRRILGRTPMKRLGDPAEVAEVVAFLLSSGARYMTGEIVYVDGGRRALNYSVTLDA
jgi:NAD(P)-dependent dehydrogenase (short-subunit alcohol dehydrogenase family)